MRTAGGKLAACVRALNGSASGASVEKQMQVRLLPGPRPRVAGKGTLPGAELRSVHDPAPVARDGRGDGLVQHLVKHDQLDEMARHLLVVERGMDADELLLVQVDAHLHRAAPAERRAPAPADPGVDLAVELLRVEASEDHGQIVDAAALLEQRRRPIAGSPDEIAVGADVGVDGGAMRAAGGGPGPREGAGPPARRGGG